MLRPAPAPLEGGEDWVLRAALFAREPPPRPRLLRRPRFRPIVGNGQSCRIEGRDPDLHGGLAAHGVEVCVDGGTEHKLAFQFHLYLQSRAKLRSVTRAHEPIDFRPAVRMPP